MLAINATISGDKVVISGLNQLAADFPVVVRSGLKQVVRGAHHNTMDFLNGSGGNNSKTRIGKRQIKKDDLRTGFDKKSGERVDFKLWKDAGGYPVPVRTGNLKRLLNFVDPGQSKNSNGSSFTAGPLEAVLYDSAGYASVIHQGTGSSAKFGARPFMTDGMDKFNSGAGIAKTMDAGVQEKIKQRGLA